MLRLNGCGDALNHHSLVLCRIDVVPNVHSERHLWAQAQVANLSRIPREEKMRMASGLIEKKEDWHDMRVVTLVCGAEIRESPFR
jgi:hypothetical protein